MPALPLSEAYASIDRFGEPERHINVYVEGARTASDVALRPRPALSLRYTIGTGPVVAQIYTDGEVGAGVYAISGVQAFRGETLLGTMSGSGGATIASSGAEVVFTLGGVAWLWNGSAFTEISDPDLPAVSAVIFLSGRFFYQQQDSDTWRFSGIYNAASIDGLAFATSEALPDATRGVATLNNEAWFFGSKSIEPHYATGQPDAPLQLAQGRMMPKGCAAQATIVAVDNTLFWLGDNGQVYRASNVAKVVSTPAIDAVIADLIRDGGDVAGCTAFATTFAGHEFYVLTVPDQGTFAYDAATDRWARWDSYGRDTFRILSAAQSDTAAYLGDALSGNVYGWSDDENSDDGEVITRLFSAYLPTRMRNVPNTNVSFEGAMGQGFRNDPSAEAVIEMRYSDNGKTWSPWFRKSLGRMGAYDTSVTWWRLGMIGAKGRRFEFRMTDPVVFSASGMTFNEQNP